MGDTIKPVLFWRAYTPDTTDDEARRLFQESEGRPPEKVKRNDGCVLAGPLNWEEIRESD